jgi:hypothetical protein
MPVGFLLLLTVISTVAAEDAPKPLLFNDARGLSEPHLKTLVELASAKGGRPWLINIYRRELGFTVDHVVETFFPPDTATPELRRGKFAYGSADLVDAAPYFMSKAGKYAQAPLPGRDPNVLQDERDITRPFEVVGTSPTQS